MLLIDTCEKDLCYDVQIAYPFYLFILYIYISKSYFIKEKIPYPCLQDYVKKLDVGIHHHQGSLAAIAY